MQKRKILLAIPIFIILSIGLGAVYAQTPDPDTPKFSPEMGFVIVLSSFIVAGVFYSSSGWIKRVRRVLAGEKIPLDLKKMGRSVLIGVILGIGAMIFFIYDGNPIVISNVQEFFVQVGINTATILLVDKWILGRASPNGKFTTKTDVGTGDVDDEDLTIDDIPAEVPPGKGEADAPVAPASIGNIDPHKTFFRSDSRSGPITINGKEVVLMATQPSRRRKRKGRTNYIYNIVTTNVMVYNRSSEGRMFMKMALRPQNISRYYDVFVRPPLTEQEKVWLERYDYILENQS